MKLHLGSNFFTLEFDKRSETEVIIHENNLNLRREFVTSSYILLVFVI